LHYIIFNFIKMKKIYVLLILFLSAIPLIAQIAVEGTIYSKDSGESLPGVTIVVKGTLQGSTTDVNGKYSLKAEHDATLVFSYIGYKTQEIPVHGKTALDVFLEADTRLLDEVVVVGYGVQKKSDVTGALVSLSDEDMQETHRQSIASILQGKAAGVTVTSSSGSPGRDEEINIRGISSINGSPPLWIVDGVPTSAGVNPQDIASMEILKDASATAIYGTKGANGVILITTKQGSGTSAKNGTKGKMSINYENRFSWGNMYKKLNLATAKQWSKLRSEAYSNARLPIPSLLQETYGEGTDWQDAITRTAASMNHYLSLAGGTDKISWYMSANYNDQQGIVQKSEQQSIDIRLNTSAKMTDWLRVGENFSFSRSASHLVNEDDEWNAIMIKAIAIDPIAQVKKDDGSWDGSMWNTISNPVAHLDRTKVNTKDFSLGGNMFAEITFLKDFTVTSRLGYSQTFSNLYDWKPSFFVKTGEENSQTSVTRGFYEGRDWVFSNFMTWSHQYNKHSFKAMAGVESERDYGEWFGLNASDLISEADHLIFIDNATGNLAASGYGPRNSSPDTVYFDPIDQSWWQNEGGDIDENALDDEYMFKLNASMEYVNDFKTAFIVNWAWAAVRAYALPGIWEDIAYENYNAPPASWSVEHIENINDTLTFETNINGEMMPGAYVIHLTNNASLGMESKGYDYQILKLTTDTLWVRYDNTFPDNLGDFYNPDDLASEGAIPGDPDEAYLKLVRKK